MHNTQIIIDVQAPNNTEILTCVRETFEFMPGWIFAHNISNCPTDARFFAFDLTYHTFNWWRTNTTFSDTMDEDEMPIKDLADISNLLEFVWVNGENLRTKYIAPDYNPPPKKKRKKTEEEEVEDLSEAFQKFFNAPKKPTAEEIVQIQPMNLPKASVFYLDTVLGMTMTEPENKDISEALFENFSEKIHCSKTIPAIHGIIKGLLGLHGPRVDELKKMASKAIDKIDAASAIIGGMPLPYETTLKVKLSKCGPPNKSVGYEAELHEIMAQKYEEYLYSMQKKKVHSWYDEPHTYHKHKPYSYSQWGTDNEGIFIKPCTYPKGYSDDCY